MADSEGRWLGKHREGCANTGGGLIPLFSDRTQAECSYCGEPFRWVVNGWVANEKTREFECWHDGKLLHSVSFEIAKNVQEAIRHFGAMVAKQEVPDPRTIPTRRDYIAGLEEQNREMRKLLSRALADRIDDEWLLATKNLLGSLKLMDVVAETVEIGRMRLAVLEQYPDARMSDRAIWENDAYRLKWLRNGPVTQSNAPGFLGENWQDAYNRMAARALQQPRPGDL